MKKFLYTLVIGLFLSGCSIGSDMGNTPTKRVEEYLNNYQILNTNVLEQLDSIVERESTFNESQKQDYRDIMKKHFQDLNYKIKEETVNGDKATVEVEIEVNDYTKVLKGIEDYKTSNENEFIDESGIFDDIKFNNYKLDLLKNNTEKVKYTIYFSLTKNNDDWQLDDLTSSEEEKILGIYEY